ncbi:hypothetical protein VHUM_01312 [Vanrija humicola]|uniref:G-patch domain-containing protein n=1 Tax=Vanrija humicola TaxID=5417 RepID=A0A7D8YY60_VANHU|nr:hypothetical protein VHUM_01312 [Vanrija humicola]
MDTRDDPPPPPRHRGLGFFPEAQVIRDPHPGARPADTPDAWTQWKDWHTNASGHGGRSRLPPVFVRAEGSYDELGRSVVDGYGVEVDAAGADEDEGAGKEKGADVADWYRALSGASTPRSSTPKAAVPAPAPVLAPRTEAGPSKPPDIAAPAPPPPAAAPAAPLRVHRSEWFIRRALASQAKATSAPAAPPPPRSSIGALLNIDAARPPPAPAPRYVLGPENAGYGRLTALGWGGGGLGRPVGGDVAAPPSGARQPVVDADGTVDLTGVPSDSDDGDDEDDAPPPPSGPGRTAPIATALKLDRAGLGRRGAPQPKVTHSAAEIDAAQRRAGRQRATQNGEMGKKQKVKWAQRERQERESRKRIAAMLR